MDFWGNLSRSRKMREVPRICQPPVKYVLIDFGHSIQLPTNANPEHREGIWPVLREQRAPETNGKVPFGPFAADVYRTGHTIYTWCEVNIMSPRLAHMISLSQAQTFISKVLEVLGVIQDMTNTRPELRLSAEEASLQMRMAVETVQKKRGISICIAITGFSSSTSLCHTTQTRDVATSPAVKTRSAATSPRRMRTIFKGGFIGRVVEFSLI